MKKADTESHVTNIETIIMQTPDRPVTIVWDNSPHEIKISMPI